MALSGTGGRIFSRVEPRHKRELVKLLIEMVTTLDKINIVFRIK
jgi:hypothetical protein